MRDSSLLLVMDQLTEESGAEIEEAIEEHESFTPEPIHVTEGGRTYDRMPEPWECPRCQANATARWRTTPEMRDMCPFHKQTGYSPRNRKERREQEKRARRASR